MVIVIAILAFGVLIAVHELGHFVAAKAFGVKVEEFSLGMGPLIFKKQGRETLYSLRLLPIGGFCAMEGEDEEVESDRAFSSQKKWKRAIILVAGSAMNFLMGFVLLLCIAPMANFTEPIIEEFMPGCPYVGEVGFMEGDRIYSVDGHRTFFTNHVSQYMLSSGSDSHDIVIIREGRRVVLEDYNMPLVEYTQEDGTTTMKYGLYFKSRDYGLLANIKYSWFCSLDFVRSVWESLRMLFTGAVGIRDMSGPVGIVSFVNDVAQESAFFREAAFDICYIFALIAVNLAVMNMLPIPALDGGRVLFILLNGVIWLICRKKIPEKYEGYVHTGAFILLILFMVVIAFKDVWMIFR